MKRHQGLTSVDNALAVPPEVGLRLGISTALPTASVKTLGEQRVYDGRAYVCVESTTGVYAWDTLGSGLILIDADTFSAVASHSTGAVFTADYADYLVVVNLSMSASNTILSGRFRVAGADDTNSNYHSTVAQIINSYTQSANGTTAASTMTLLPNLGVGNTATDVSMTYVVSNPQATAETLLYGQSVLRYGAPAVALYPTGILFNNTTSFDALSLIPASGTITGTIKIFGIRGT